MSNDVQQIIEAIKSRMTGTGISFMLIPIIGTRRSTSACGFRIDQPGPSGLPDRTMFVSRWSRLLNVDTK